MITGGVGGRVVLVVEEVELVVTRVVLVVLELDVLDDELEELLELDELLLEDELLDDELLLDELLDDELVVLARSTSGPAAWQWDCARMTSSTGVPGMGEGMSVRCTALTVIDVLPGVVAVAGTLLMICSLRIAEPSPRGRVIGVFAAGVVSNVLRPTRPLAIWTLPTDPSPFDVHWLEMTSAMSPAPAAPTCTPATSAKLDANPKWLMPVTLPPWLAARNAEMARMPGRFTGIDELSIGP
jgi:hypothetical protein